MSIVNHNELIQALTNVDRASFLGFKPNLAGRTAGDMTALWRVLGIPGVGDIPAAAATCTNGMPGAFVLPAVTGGRDMYIANLFAGTIQSGSLFLFDRLSHMGGLSGTVTTAQTVNLAIADAAAQGRCRADGLDVMWFVEIYTALGTTGQNLTVTYTNQAGTTGRTVVVPIRASAPGSLVLPIIPGGGDRGIRSVQSVQLAGTTGTAGNFGVTARKKISVVPMDVAGVMIDYAGTGLVRILGNECVEMLCHSPATATGDIWANFIVIQG